MLYILTILVGFIVLVFVLRRYVRFSLRGAILTAAIAGVLLFLALTGKMNWLFAMVATISLAIFKLVRSPVGFLLLGAIRRLFSRRRTRPSIFRSDNIVIRIDPFSGIIDGEVLQGEKAGCRLSQLSEDEICELLNQWRETDPRSARITDIYLRYIRQFGFGRQSQEQAGFADGDGGANAPNLEEAREILGIRAEDDWPTVVVARTRLLSRVHPDKGGNTWMTQKINQAWQVLKNHHDKTDGDDAKPTQEDQENA